VIHSAPLIPSSLSPSPSRTHTFFPFPAQSLCYPHPHSHTLAGAHASSFFRNWRSQGVPISRPNLFSGCLTEQTLHSTRWPDPTVLTIAPHSSPLDQGGAAGANSQGGQDAAAAAADEYRVAREWLLSKNFRVQTWATTHSAGTPPPALYSTATAPTALRCHCPAPHRATSPNVAVRALPSLTRSKDMAVSRSRTCHRNCQAPTECGV
jgi:hypothetical protein